MFLLKISKAYFGFKYCKIQKYVFDTEFMQFLEIGWAKCVGESGHKCRRRTIGKIEKPSWKGRSIRHWYQIFPNNSHDKGGATSSKMLRTIICFRNEVNFYLLKSKHDAYKILNTK